MESLEEHLLNVHVILISAAAWFILWTLRRVWKGIDTNLWVSRYKPLYPAIICQGFVWIPGALPAEQDPTIGYRILIALWCGFLASIGYQVVKRVLLPRGIELPNKAEELLPDAKSADDNPASDEKDDDLRSTKKETPAVQEEPERKPYMPPKTDDLFKPPKM